jgi:preprotein translocase subunit YajC
MHLLSTLASSDNGGNGGAAVVQLGILLLIPLALYFLMIRPQRRRMRQQNELQTSLEVGDEVITTSGVYGFITGFEEDRVWLEIDDDVQIRLTRSAISGKVNTSAPAADTAGSGGGGGAGGGYKAKPKAELPESNADKADKSASDKAE